jgi:general secretion pathway protein H
LPRERRQGFTLLELLIVLAILSLVVGIAFPLFATRAPTAALNGAAQEVRAALAAARSAAIAENREVAFAGAQNGYRIDGAFHRLPIARDLLVGIRGGARIAFFPSGGSSGGRVMLRNAAAVREIDIEAITGRATLVP